ncbi:DNA N-6-adenine-methyltransferase [Escherichia coli]|uniref:DNA N-6-adenine-methyltransferase n=1 Tax=Escherichia coli TaxID=562 RepID=UPI0010D3945D|nr:DNA N-6-adenine-methyltransferase [Escherichia coli]EFJ5619194.1 DNA methylase [Escherichia coli]EFO0582399.1 DNA methylase [Escherichia coli]EGI4669828.1 DNA methylase [Escherichia coli]MDA6567475.1 DNA N-6-adenine-methyltransferase [Escherichia coli]GDS48914.1 phage N-6-adenine-methyltransferase [Escherichia coli]
MSHPIINVGRYHGGSDDWRTPYRLFHNLHREFNFSLDGAATEYDALLPRFTDDIHNQSWDGERVFCNPPYSDTKTFLVKASEADLAVFLIPYRPHTTYWLKHLFTNPLCHEIRILHRAVKYLPPAGHNGLAIRSPFASAIVIFKSESRKVEITQMVCCADTLLPLTIINRGGLRGRPTIYPPETLDSFIKLYRQGKPIKYIADALRMPLSTSYRIAQRLG